MVEPGRAPDSVDGFLRELGDAPVPADLASAIASGVRSQGGRQSGSRSWRAVTALAAVLVAALLGSLLLLRVPAGIVSSSPSPGPQTIQPGTPTTQTAAGPSPSPNAVEPSATPVPSDEAWVACTAVLSQFTTVDGSAVVAAYRVTGAQYAYWYDHRTEGHVGHAPDATPPFLPFPGVPLDATADVCFMDGFFEVPGPGPDATRAVIVIYNGFPELTEGGPKEGIAIEDPRLSAWPSPGPVGDGLDRCQENLTGILAVLPPDGEHTVVGGFLVTAGTLANLQESIFTFDALDYHSAWRGQPSDLPVLMCYVDGALQTRSEQGAGTSRDTRFVVLLYGDQIVVDSYGPRDNVLVTDPRGWPVPGPGSPIRSQFTTVELPAGADQSLKLRIDHGAYKPYLVSARPATSDEIAAVLSDQVAPIGPNNLQIVHPGGDLFSLVVSWQGSCEVDARLTITMERAYYALDEGARTQCADPPATHAVLLTFNKHSLAQDAVVEFHPGATPGLPVPTVAPSEVPPTPTPSAPAMDIQCSDGTSFHPPPTLLCNDAVAAALRALENSPYPTPARALFFYGDPCAPGTWCAASDPNKGYVVFAFADGTSPIYVSMYGLSPGPVKPYPYPVPPPLVRETSHGDVFEHPDTWHLWQPNDFSPMNDGPIYYLSTDPLTSDCAVAPGASPNPADAQGRACDWPLASLSRNGVLVEWTSTRLLLPMPTGGVGFMPVNDHWASVDRPGLCAAIGADETVTFLVPPPPNARPANESNVEVIACQRGPDEFGFQKQIQAFLASATELATPIPASDPRAKSCAATRDNTRGMIEISRSSDFWLVFPHAGLAPELSEVTGRVFLAVYHDRFPGPVTGVPGTVRPTPVPDTVDVCAVTDGDQFIYENIPLEGSGF